MTIKERNLGYTSSAQSVWDDLYVDSHSNKIDEKYLADSVDLWLYNTYSLYNEIGNRRRKAYSVVYEALLSLFQTNVDDNLEGKKVRVTSEMVKGWFKKHNADFKEILKPVVDTVEESRQEMFDESSFSKRNNKKSPIKEKTEKGSLDNMLTMFNSKIEDLEFEDFDESIDIDEAREMHTWNITYIGKGNKARNHIVDAPDAYEANRKARRELGISYTDIDDVTMVENKNNLKEDYLSSSEADKVYSELKNVFDDFSDNMVETVEADYDSYKKMSEEDISFEEWFRDTKENYPDYFKYIFAIMFEEYKDSAF